ncbi:hypothetical protein ABZ953_21055 [Streptomyces sp. NPDC046465]|uniref:hypothetical protein n=1 Tax=Streptomyces sp. NPDC046465 TaxID=3155810 RepID=UPI0033F456A8
MRIRTVFAAAAIAALTVLGGAGAASADDFDGHGGDILTHISETSVAAFGDMDLD